MREQLYRIRVGTVTLTTPDGWTTSRQVPEFAVYAISPGHAARLARDIILSANVVKDARVCFGMLDENNDYFDEKEAER